MATTRGNRPIKRIEEKVVGWARDQATSRGSWGEYSAISRKTNETKQRPNQHYDECRLPFCGLSATVGWVGALNCLHAVGLACRVRGRVCQVLMRPTSHAVSKRLGAALLVLVRALLSSYRSYDWCLSIRPMTPEMRLDLEPIPHPDLIGFQLRRVDWR